MILDELRSVLSPAELARFLAIYAGTDVRFHSGRDSASFRQLARVVGSDAATRLRHHFGGERIYVPRSAAEERERRNEEIRSRIAAGESPLSIARSYRTVTTMSERHVRRIAAEGRAKSLANASEATLERTLVVDRHVAAVTSAAVGVRDTVRRVVDRIKPTDEFEGQPE